MFAAVKGQRIWMASTHIAHTRSMTNPQRNAKQITVSEWYMGTLDAVGGCGTTVATLDDRRVVTVYVRVVRIGCRDGGLATEDLAASTAAANESPKVLAAHNEALGLNPLAAVRQFTWLQFHGSSPESISIQWLIGVVHQK